MSERFLCTILNDLCSTHLLEEDLRCSELHTARVASWRPTQHLCGMPPVFNLHMATIWNRHRKNSSQPEPQQELTCKRTRLAISFVFVSVIINVFYFICVFSLNSKKWGRLPPSWVPRVGRALQWSPPLASDNPPLFLLPWSSQWE